MSMNFLKVQTELAKAHKDKSGKKKVLLFVYYSGHGVMDNTTKIVMNEEELNFRYFPLEAKLSNISKYQNSFIVTIFDCCRE